MAFDVSLIFQIDAVLIAEVVPIGSIGIVRVAHVVDVATLHEEHFLFHLLTGDVVTRLWIVLVTVYTLKLNGLTIEEVITTCQAKLVLLSWCVFDFNLAETYVSRESFYYMALLIFQFTHQGVTIRSLSTPRLNALPSLERNFCREFASLAYLAYLCRSGNVRYEGILITIQLVLIE